MSTEHIRGKEYLITFQFNKQHWNQPFATTQGIRKMAVVNGVVQSLDLKLIQIFNGMGPKRPKKRKASVLDRNGETLYNDDDGDNTEDSLGIKDPTYLTIADTCIKAQGQVPRPPNEESPQQVGSVLQLDDISLNFQNSILIVQNKPRQKYKAKNIMSLEIKDELYNQIGPHEIKFCRNLKLKHASSVKLSYPKLSINFLSVEQDHYEIEVLIDYKVELIESLALNTRLTDTQLGYIKDLIKSIAVYPNPPESNIEINTKFFYDMITQHTESIPKETKPLLVSELDTDLLRFQTTSVKWLLTKENVLYDDESRSVKPSPIWSKSMSNDDEKVLNALDSISFGFKLIKIPFYDEELWYNDYTQNICSKNRAIEFLTDWDFANIGGTGLLAEEMGLGKTVETVALTLLNQRPFNDINQDYFETSLQRMVKQLKSTLIVCPESILHQWCDEIELHAPSLTIMIYKGINSSKQTCTELVEEMSKHDIILTSYSVISREVHNALYNPSSRPKRQRRTPTPRFLELELDPSVDIEPEALESLKQIYQQVDSDRKLIRDRDDHSSPLVMCEFWRIIMDEVQMVGKTLSNVCKIATRIPRFHSWGVSGTPIKNELSDLNSILSYLRIEPFGSLKNWESLVGKPNDFIKLFKNLSLRHTKEMVKSDISIPLQEKYLLSVPFGPIEQNNYEELYKQFLNEVGLDVDGNPIVENWEPSQSYYDYMSHWLKKLRRVCCHANIGNNDHQSGNENSALQTMDRVLKNMIEIAQDRVNQLNRDITSKKIEIGQVYEFERKPQNALDVWSQELPNVEKRIESLQTQSINNDKSKLNLRINLDLLHRLYFFIASAHYQLYNPPITELVPGIDKDMLPHDVDPRLGGDEHISPDVVVYRVLTEQESNHQVLEQEFYAKAQNVRKTLLAEPIKNVSNSVTKLDRNFQLEFIDFIPKSFQTLDTQAFSTRVGTVITQLNSQSSLLNNWLGKLVNAISTPLLDGVTDPDGEEYGESLDDQEKAAAYLDVLQRAIQDRHSLIFGKNDHGDFEKIDAIVESSDSDFKDQLEQEYPKIMMEFSLRHLVIESKTILAGMTVVSDMDPFAKLIVEVRKIFELQKENMDSVKKFFKIINDCYNLRITYFRQLQDLSDNVRPFDEYSHANYDCMENLLKLKNKIEIDEKNLTSIHSRIRYLQSLSSAETDESDKLCVVCRSSITIGSLTKCGHQYCKDCLDHWLARHSKCPICKQSITKVDVYNFTFNRDEINVRMITEESNEEMFQVYHKMDKNNLYDINSIKIKNNFGSKVNTIVKQVLWLKKHDPYVQIVIYSQWTQLLQIIGNAFRQNGITYLGSKNTLPRIGKGKKTALKSDIAQFKKNPEITCFLLNAKAEASGLTLVNATHVFICEPLVNTALELQAISRIHRIGQKKPTFVWLFSITGSVEESIILLSTRKKVKEREKLDTEEMTKTVNKLVEANGEHVNPSDLWNSFFSAKIDRIV